MLDKEVFNAGVKRLVTEYSDKGFKMTKERASQWYGFMKDMSNSEFEKRVKNCLMTCKKNPTMADVLGLKENGIFEPANAGAYEVV